MIKIEGIDYDDMVSRLMCDDNTCLDIIKTFYTDISDKFIRLCNEKDNDRFISLAHGIKGSCANIGAWESYELAKKLELKARSYGRHKCRKEFTDLYFNLKKLFGNIYDYLKNGNT